MDRKPNLIWIVTDQQRFETLGINGGRNARTPNLDMLAREGVNVTSAYAGVPLCCPFRGSMLTSAYPHRCVPGHEFRMPQERMTIAHAFDAQGYDTFHLGKWHLDGAKESEEPTSRHIVPRGRRGGFRSWIGYENNNAPYDCWIHGHRGDKEIESTRLPSYEADALTDLLLEYIAPKAEDPEPFFAVLSMQPPHDPYLAPASYAKDHRPADIRFLPNVPDIPSVRSEAARDLAGYYAMVENIDANVGRIVSALSSSGLLDRTHLMFFSDHGDMHGSHGQFRKLTPYQEAVHIPLIIAGEKRGTYYPDRFAEQRGDVLFHPVDLAPTSLGLCGLPVPDWMEGKDLSFVRRKDRNCVETPKSVYLQSVIPTGHPCSVNKPWRGIVTVDGYKYVCFESMDWLMFDLNEDPYEQRNLAHDDRFLDLRRRLNGELRDWVERTGDSFPLPEGCT